MAGAPFRDLRVRKNSHELLAASTAPEVGTVLT
jgi:hypothetical protein